MTRTDGVAIGFDEAGRKVLLPTAPVTVVAGGPGAGKSMLGLSLLGQLIEVSPNQVVMLEGLPGEGAPVCRMGGVSVSLGDLVGEDGPLDPLRTNASEEERIGMAAEIVAAAFPLVRQGDVAPAISHGVASGHRALWTSLSSGVDAGLIDSGLVFRMRLLAEEYPVLRLVFGLSDESPGLALPPGLLSVDPDLHRASDSPDHLAAAGHAASLVALGSASDAGGTLHLYRPWGKDRISSQLHVSFIQRAKRLGVNVIEYVDRPSRLPAEVRELIDTAIIGYQDRPSEADEAATVPLLRTENREECDEILRRISLHRHNFSFDGTDPDTLMPVTNQGRVIQGARFFVTTAHRSGATLAEATLPEEFLDLFGEPAKGFSVR